MDLAPSVASGAMMTSVKMLAILAAVTSSSVRLRATTPPKAEIGSQASARSQASDGVAAEATPHGLACLMMTMVGSGN